MVLTTGAASGGAGGARSCTGPEAGDAAPALDAAQGLALPARPAQVHNFLLGGKDHYRQDEAVAAAVHRADPRYAASVRAGRRFMTRVARHLADERGLRQFLDVGAGLPLRPDLHDVVQQVQPAGRVVYVDNDPVVTSHVRALAGASAEGMAEGLLGDLRAPDRILVAPEVARALDPGEPVAITALAVLESLPDDVEVADALATLLAPFPRGSALALCTLCSDGVAAEAGAVERAFAGYAITVRHRPWGRIRGLFRGLALEPPGVVPVHRWRPGPADRGLWDRRITMVGGVGIKP
jgi:S-adenosyl methyltransferase